MPKVFNHHDLGKSCMDQNYEEIEDVVPRRWINTEKKILFWPSGIFYRRAVNDEMDADETWDKYKLIKIKFESDNINELKEYVYTTAAEEEDEIDHCFTSSKGAFKVKSNVYELPDFLLHPPVLQSIPTKSLKRSFDFNLSPGSNILKQSSICSALPHSLPLHTEEQSTSYSESLSLPNFFQPSESTEKEQSNFFTVSPHTQEFKKKKTKEEVQKKTTIEALGPEKLVKNQFPMEVGKYQHMMFKMVSKILENQELIIAVKQLSFLGAEDYKQLTRLVINRLFTNTLLAQFNLKGSGGKIGLLSTKIYDVIEEVVTRRFGKVSNI
ncbi:uncharacterized protein LOC124807162 isoform X2 [Hydra vulgaris]|uniref:uncharacterized protein LOC124807162 isoform X2 n=1 Tax=Hydra vulgaris TaxID=6087 RepID=UPI001F5ED179|nr:uncharacterized protein LOC124807162 isoform X2 [Hydra vulgaris]